MRLTLEDSHNLIKYTRLLLDSFSLLAVDVGSAFYMYSSVVQVFCSQNYHSTIHLKKRGVIIKQRKTLRDVKLRDLVLVARGRLENRVLRSKRARKLKTAAIYISV